MYFGLSDNQTLLQDSVRRTLERDAPLDDIRKFAQGDNAPLHTIHASLTELGLPLTLIPEAEGGLGLGVLEVALVQEMLGRYAAPSPFAAAYGMAVAGLRVAQADKQAKDWLGRIASGVVIMAVGVNEQIDCREDCGVAASGDKLSGKARFLLGADLATHYLLAIKEGLAIIEKDAKGVKEIALTTIDKTRNVCALELKGATAHIIKDKGAAVAAMINSGRVLLAADTLGAADMMLEKAVAYAKEREQFNRPIGSFQAVKHMCAEMAAKLEPCRALVWYAAYAQDNSEEDSEAALMSRLAQTHLSEVGQYVARTATEVHGGMGFTDLLGLHYWFKRIGSNRLMLGAPEFVRAEAAALQNWGTKIGDKNWGQKLG